MYIVDIVKLFICSNSYIFTLMVRIKLTLKRHFEMNSDVSKFHYAVSSICDIILNLGAMNNIFHRALYLQILDDIHVFCIIISIRSVMLQVSVTYIRRPD